MPEPLEGNEGERNKTEPPWMTITGRAQAPDFSRGESQRLTFLTTTTGITQQQLTETLQDRDAKIDRLERQVDELSMFLRHVSANWQPTEPPPKEKVEIKWNPAEHGLKWPLSSKREKTE